MPAKPMWKLYLVWAILSSVTLLYVISSRCNVMSTIKTHTHTPVGCFVFVVAFHFWILPRLLNTSESGWKRLAVVLSLCQCEIQTLCSNIDRIRRFKRISLLLCLVLEYSRRGLSLSSDITVTSRILFVLVFRQLWCGVDWWNLTRTHKKTMIPGWHRERIDVND